MSSPPAAFSPDESNQFNFACPCLNAHILCRLPSSSTIPDSVAAVSEGDHLRKIHLGERPEVIVSCIGLLPATHRAD